MIKFGKCCNLDGAPLAAADGFDYFETSVAEAFIPDQDEAAWQEHKLRLRDIAIPLHASNGFLPGTMRITGPDARPDQALDYAECACRRADETGCKYIVFGSGGARNVPGDFLVPGNRPAVERGREQFAKFCADLARRIDGCRVTVAIEPLCPNEDNVVNYVWQALQIVHEVDSPRIEVLADFFHMMHGRETADSIIAAGPHLKHCHVATNGTRCYPGYEPYFDLAPYFEALRKIGYAGGVSIEGGWPLKDGQTMSDAHKIALAALRELANQ